LASFYGRPKASLQPMSQLEDYLRREAKILRNAEPKVLITVTAALRLGALLRGLVPSLSTMKSVGDLQPPSDQLSLPRVKDLDATAIQYTSGSTGDPKLPMCWPIFALF
jgi:acyl-coenzyme A synthetase/AMP-(fatty) acid ligase